jgi:predicted lipid-binding transport protein (Tim44 family)
MTTYTLHVPDDAAPGDPEALERAQVVADGFSWTAFFFTVLWFFAHRLWIAGLGVLAGLVALGALIRVLGVTPGAAFLAYVLVALLIGLEANALRRWTYARRGRPAVEAVSAANATEATVKLYEEWLGARAARPVVPAASRPAYAPHDAVLGLFPDAERTR